MRKSKNKEKVNEGTLPVALNGDSYRNIFNLCLLGCNNERIAELMCYKMQDFLITINKDKRLQEIMNEGRELADGVVASALFNKATGYTDPKGDYHEPDVQAIKFWLQNRSPKLWGTQQQDEQVLYVGITSDLLRVDVDKEAAEQEYMKLKGSKIYDGEVRKA